MAKELLAILPEAYPNTKFTYMAEHREIRGHDGSAVLFLGNLFNRVKYMPRKERTEELIAFVTTVLESKDPERFIERLMPRARTSFEIWLRKQYAGRLTDKEGIEELVNYPVCDSLVLELVIDGATTVRSVSTKDLVEHDVTAGQALKIANANLHRASDSNGWQEINPGVWRSSFEDDYDFARIFVGSELGPPIDPAIIYAPSQSAVGAAAPDDIDALTVMIELAGQAAQEHRPLSEYLWRYTDGRIGRWNPGEHEPGYSIANLQLIRETIKQYEEQSELIYRQLESRGEDSFVAQYIATQNADGQISSYCTYTMNLPSYLPRTDFVMLFDPESGKKGEVLGKVSWTEFSGALGLALKNVEGFIPPRFALLEDISSATRDDLIANLRPA
ncbi:MAG: hypothetical protein O3C28_17655 [Proteobacteria bacterium]|nr:hypothetical protein [Pseudomonadota bacterium]